MAPALGDRAPARAQFPLVGKARRKSSSISGYGFAHRQSVNCASVQPATCAPTYRPGQSARLIDAPGLGATWERQHVPSQSPRRCTS